MEGKNIFTLSEIETIRQLVKLYSKANSASEQKAARVKLRRNNFYVSDYGIQNITPQVFEGLLVAGKVKVLGNHPKPSAPPTPTINKVKVPISVKSNARTIDWEEKLICGNFKKAAMIDNLVPNEPGFYCIKLAEGSHLPERYQKHIKARSHSIIYIGKAENQTLKKRFLGQELRARGHGTFFRSIGAVLGFLPEKGSLLNYKNKNNYTFKAADELKIISWINSNLEVSWIAYSGDFSIERDWIAKYCPLLNDTHNPNKLNELREDKAYCRAFSNC